MEVLNCVDFSVVNFLLGKVGRDVTYFIILNVHKSVVRNAMIEKFGRGESRSARKRRANKLGRCHICGRFKHDDPCSSNQTKSQHEFTVLFKSDPIRLNVEKSLNEKGYAYSRLVENINLIRDKTRVLRI